MKITILMLFTRMAEQLPSLKVRIPKKYQLMPLQGIRLYSSDLLPEEDHYLYICDPHVPEVKEDIAKTNPVIFIADHRPDGLDKHVIFLKSTAGTATIFNALQQIWNQFLNWDRSIHEAILQNPSFDNMLLAASSLAEETILIYDRGLKLLAHVNLNGSDDRVLTESVNIGYLPPEITREFSKEHIFDPTTRNEPIVFAPAHSNAHVTMYQPFVISDQIVGFCVMLCHNQDRLDYSRQIFMNFYPSASICMQQHLKNRHASGRLEEYTLIHILENNSPTEEEQMKSRIELTPLPFKSDFILLNISFPADAASMRSYLVHRLQLSLNGCAVFEYKDSALLLFYKNLDILNYRQQTIDRLSTCLPDFEQYNLFCIASIPFRKITGLQNAFRQTQSISLKDCIPSDQRYSGICFFEDHLLRFIKKTLYEKTGISTIYPLLDVIIEKEGDKYSSLRELLLTYISSGFNITNTASALHMHRNNVIYHVKRMENKYGINFRNMEEIIKLYIALL